MLFVVLFVYGRRLFFSCYFDKKKAHLKRYIKIEMLFIYFLFLLFGQALSWGAIGHNIIVHLAQSQLDNATGEWIRSLTPWHWNGNLSAMASWADDIFRPDTNPTEFANWLWSSALHFINTPDWACNYDYERDCSNDRCAEGAIRNYTKRLEESFDEIQQKEALYFLIHFVGDIHQPLHTAFTTDRGGNSVKVQYMNSSYITSLHSIWDSAMILTRIRRDFQGNNSLYYEHIFDLMLNQTSNENDTKISQWVDENLSFVCSQIYLDEQNSTMNVSVNYTLGDIYYNRSIPIIEQRLALGGRRLRLLFQEIYQNRQTQPTPHSQDDKLCSGTIALIVVLSIEFFIAIIIGIIVGLRFRKKRVQSRSFSYSPNQI